MSREDFDESQPENDPTLEDAPRTLLNRMRSAAVERGEVRMDAAQAQQAQSRSARSAQVRSERRNRNFVNYSDARDPQGLGGIMKNLVQDRGWNAPVAVGSVMTRWEELVGADIAAHCKPVSFDNGIVVIRTDSTSWASQMRILNHQLLKVFSEKLGGGVVREIKVLGPTAPSWRKGMRTVKGRGPRDTYG
ncbi:DUF721 domain-containing protein [Neomicrococcus lactis]